MSEITIKRKPIPKDLKYLSEILKMFIRQGELLRITQKGKTWEDLCNKASNEKFAYEYILESHEVKVSDKLRNTTLTLPLEKHQ